MLKPAFIDLSHHNVRSYEPAVEVGIIGVIHKLTEGTTFVDSMVRQRFPIARELGLLWGLYHFIRPGKIVDQAHWFIKNASGVCDDNTLFALDWEDKGVSIDDALLWLDAVQDATQHEPVIYSGHVMKEALAGKPNEKLSQYRLWLAQYTSGTPTLPPGFAKFWGWQYTDSGQIDGIEPPTDLNAYDGPAEALRADWSGA